MFEIKENHRFVDHKKVTTYSRKVVGANILEVEAGTTGFCGGDGGHGGRTYFRVKDLAGTAIDVLAIGGGRGFEVALAGDSELETIITALNFITQVLEEELLEAKADGYARIIANMDAQVTAFKEEEKKLKEKRERLEDGVDQLRKTLFQSMKETGKTKFHTDLFWFKIVKNGGKAPIVLDVPEEDLPDDLVKVTVTRKADKDAIAKYIEETGDQTYAHVGERGERLSIK